MSETLTLLLTRKFKETKYQDIPCFLIIGLQSVFNLQKNQQIRFQHQESPTQHHTNREQQFFATTRKFFKHFFFKMLIKFVYQNKKYSIKLSEGLFQSVYNVLFKQRCDAFYSSQEHNKFLQGSNVAYIIIMYEASKRWWRNLFNVKINYF